MSTEIEFKWEANTPRAFYQMQRAVRDTGGRLLNEKNWHISDVYMDTSGRDFEKQQIAFRLRCANQKWEATFKTRTEIVNGQAVRREETLPIPNAKNFTQALGFLQNKKCWLGLRLTDLRVLFVLKNRRKTHDIVQGGLRAELAFDTCRLEVCGRRVCFKEIELELKKGAKADFEKLTSQLTHISGLKRVRISKVKTALSLLKLWSDK